MCYKVISEVKMTKESLLETADDYMSINIQVDGFWTDTVSATLRLRGQQWEIDQRHSSGGNDKGDKLQQEINMATAMIDLAQFLRSTFTAEFQRELTDAVEAKKAKYKAEREAAILAYNKELDEKSPALGEDMAKNLVEAAKAKAKIDGVCWVFAATRTTSDNPESCGFWYKASLEGGKVRFRRYGSKPYAVRLSDTSAVSAADVVSSLEDSSKIYTRLVSEIERREINRQWLAA